MYFFEIAGFLVVMEEDDGSWTPLHYSGVRIDAIVIAVEESTFRYGRPITVLALRKGSITHIHALREGAVKR